MADVAFDAYIRMEAILADDATKVTTMSKNQKDIVKDDIEVFNFQATAMQACLMPQACKARMTSTKMLVIVAATLMFVADTFNNVVVHTLPMQYDEEVAATVIKVTKTCFRRRNLPSYYPVLEKTIR